MSGPFLRHPRHDLGVRYWRSKKTGEAFAAHTQPTPHGEWAEVMLIGTLDIPPVDDNEGGEMIQAGDPPVTMEWWRAASPEFAADALARLALHQHAVDHPRFEHGVLDAVRDALRDAVQVPGGSDPVDTVARMLLHDARLRITTGDVSE